MRVVAAVIRNKERFLACRRASHKDHAGKWEFPGGKVEVGETDEVALEREIQEELGVVITVEKLIAKTSLSQGENHVEMFTYMARLNYDRPEQSSDHDRMEWLPLNELKKYDWADLDVPVIEKLMEIFQ